MTEPQHPFPRRFASYTFTVHPEYFRHKPSDGWAELKAKLKAEEERLLRLLPDAPEGHHWHMDYMMEEDPTTDPKVRVVALLVEDM